MITIPSSNPISGALAGRLAASDMEVAAEFIPQMTEAFHKGCGDEVVERFLIETGRRQALVLYAELLTTGGDEGELFTWDCPIVARTSYILAEETTAALIWYGRDGASAKDFGFRVVGAFLRQLLRLMAAPTAGGLQ